MIGCLVRFYDMEEYRYTYGIVISDGVIPDLGPQRRLKVVWFDNHGPTVEMKSDVLSLDASPEVRVSSGAYIELVGKT